MTVPATAWRACLPALRVRRWEGEATAVAFDAQAGQAFLVGSEHARLLAALAPGQGLSEPVLRARFEGLDVCRILQELEAAGFVRREAASGSGS